MAGASTDVRGRDTERSAHALLRNEKGTKKWALVCVCRAMRWYVTSDLFLEAHVIEVITKKKKILDGTVGFSSLRLDFVP